MTEVCETTNINQNNLKMSLDRSEILKSSDCEDLTIKQVAMELVSKVIESASQQLQQDDCEELHEVPSTSENGELSKEDDSAYSNDNEYLQNESNLIRNAEISTCHSLEDLPSAAEVSAPSSNDFNEESITFQSTDKNLTDNQYEKVNDDPHEAEESGKGDSLEERKQNKSELEETGEEEKQPKVEQEDLDVLGNGLLKKKVLKEGEDKETRPQRGQEVEITMETRLKDGTVVQEEESVTLVVSERDVVDAVDLTLNLMKKGETSLITSDSKYCYGKIGKLPEIPPDSDLEFTVTLNEIRDGPYSLTTPIAKRLSWVDSKREKGNQLYTEKNFHEAIHTYKKCTRVLSQARNQSHPDDVKSEVGLLLTKCQNNLAASHMMIGEWRDALEEVQKSEKIDKNNVKTICRKAKILLNLGELKKASETFKKASRLSPNDKAIQAEITKLNKKMQDQKDAQQKMYQRMFWGKDGKSLTEKETDSSKNKKSSWFPSRNIVFGSSLVAIGAFLIGSYLLHR